MEGYPEPPLPPEALPLVKHVCNHCGYYDWTVFEEQTDTVARQCLNCGWFERLNLQGETLEAYMPDP